MMDFERAAVPYWPIRRRKLLRRRLLIGALIVAVIGTVVGVRHHLASEPIGKRIFDEVATTVSARYYDRSFHGLDWSKIMDEYRPKVERAATETERYALLGDMLAKFGDSHTAIFSPTQVERVQDQGTAALGAVFVTLGGDRVVLRVAPRSPAASAGLRPGFIIAERGSADSSEAAVRSYLVRDPLTGRTWQTKLRVAAGDSFEAVEPPDLDWGIAAPGIGYLRMASFPNDIGEELGWAVSDIGTHPAMVLDLRGNPGGLIDAVEATAGIFLPPGSLVVTGAGRYAFFGRRKFEATDDAHVRYRGRVAVLVNGNSESGAEALASALQIYKRAVIIGEPTARRVLGVEVEQRLADGGLLRVATLDMRDANGTLLEGNGVAPDVMVHRTAADVARGRDPQLRAAIAFLTAAAQPAVSSPKRR